MSNHVGNIEQQYELGTALLNQMTIFIKRYNWNETKVKVSDYFSVEQPDHQMTMFNIYPKYCTVG